MKSSLPFLIATLGVSRAFTAAPQSQSTRNLELAALHWREDGPSEKHRRSLVSTAVTAGVSMLFTRPSLADVSDGNSLPQGMLQFSRVLKVKTDLAVGDLVLCWDLCWVWTPKFLTCHPHRFPIP
jgi:hypothetical protein